MDAQDGRDDAKQDDESAIKQGVAKEEDDEEGKDVEVKEEEGEGDAGTAEKEKSVAPVIEEDPIPDPRLIEFNAKTEEQKDAMTCDEVFCMYLREIAK